MHHMADGIFFIYGMCMGINLLNNKNQILGVNAKFCLYISFKHIFGKKVKYVLQLVMFWHMYAQMLGTYVHLA